MKITPYPAQELSAEQISAWEQLQKADPTLDNPFFRPEFTLAVAAVKKNVEVAVIEEEGEPVGFFPYERVRKTVGRPVAQVMSDMHGIILRPGTEIEAVGLVRACGLMLWHFDHLPAAQTPFRRFCYALDDSPFMDLREGYAAYADRLHAGGSTLRQALRKMRKIEREVGPLRFVLHSPNADLLTTLIRWKRQQLLAGNYFDVFRLSWLPQLMQNLCAHSSRSFAGWLSALYAGDHVIALHLGLRSHAVLSSWIPTYHPEFARYSPGLLLHLEMARAAAEQGIGRIDLCRGYNQLKRTLMSGSFPVAIGTVDVSPVHRLFRHGYYRTRALVRNTPLRGTPLQCYRRLRNWAWARSAG